MKEEKTSNKKWIGALIFSVAVVLLLVLGYSYYSSFKVGSTDEKIVKVLQNPDKYYGESITLAGKVQEVKGPNTLTLDSPQIFSDKLLVISKDSLVPIGGGGDEYLYNADDRVRIEGKVYKFNTKEMEKRLGRDLVDSEFTDWEGKPVVVADSVEEDR